MYREKYIIDDYSYNGIVYRAVSCKELEKMYVSWSKNLSFKEKKAFQKYRKKINLSNNINANLREGKESLEAKIISQALSRAKLSNNIIVYRNLARHENEDMKNRIEGEIFKRNDFKGMHVKKIIRKTWPISNSAGYMILLIPRGAHVAYINNLTRLYRNEKELLIDRNQQFQLIKVIKVLGKLGYVTLLKV